MKAYLGVTCGCLLLAGVVALILIDPTGQPGSLSPAAGSPPLSPRESRLAEPSERSARASRHVLRPRVVDLTGLPVADAEWALHLGESLESMLPAALPRDEHLRLPEGLLTVSAPGYLPLAVPMSPGQTWDEFCQQPLELQRFCFVPFVEHLGEARGGAARSQDGERLKGRVRASYRALGLEPLVKRIVIDPEERVQLLAWLDEDRSAWQEGLFRVPDAQGHPLDCTIRFSRLVPQEEVRAYRNRTPFPERLHRIEIQVSHGEAWDWGAQPTIPEQVRVLAGRIPEPGVPGTARFLSARWDPARASYIGWLPSGDWELRILDRLLPMPSLEATPLPLVGVTRLHVPESPSAPVMVTVPLAQGARAVRVPTDLGIPDLPGIRWSIDHDSDFVEADQRSRYGAFTVVLQPGHYRLRWECGPFGEPATASGTEFVQVEAVDPNQGP